MKWILIGLAAAVAAVMGWANAPVQPLPLSAKADLVVVEKGQWQLIAYSRGESALALTWQSVRLIGHLRAVRNLRSVGKENPGTEVGELAAVAGGDV